MSTHKRIDMICAVAVLLTVALTVFLMSGQAFALMPVMSQSVEGAFFTANDLNADWDTAAATKIELSDKGSSISGNGAYVNDGDVCIAYAGHYILTGKLTNGSVVIDADKSDQIWILLDGVTLYCDDGAAIRVEQAGHVFLTLADGTENVLSSGAAYDEELAASGVDGTIYSRDDLTINGSGSLSVSGTYSHGIVCNDNLVITGGRLTVDAVLDGIHANDSVRVCSSVISISAGDDGITVSNDDETAFFYMESGSIVIADCYEGIEAVAVTIAGGTVDITSTDDGINAGGSGDGSLIRITGGEITIVNASGRDADGLDSNGSIYVEGGSLFISVSDSGGNCALDYGTENGGECIVSGGTVIACGGSAMAEGFDSDSSQGFLMYNVTAAEGTTICLEDSAGRELLSGEIPCSFSSIVLSAPQLKEGDVCTITVGDVQEEVTIDNSSDSGFGSAGMFGGGMRGGKNHAAQSGGRDLDDRQDMGAPEGSEDTLPASGIIEPSDGSMPSEERGRPDGMGMPEERDMPGERDMPEERNMPGEMETSSGILPDTLALVGISVAVLLIGLVFAIRIRH